VITIDRWRCTACGGALQTSGERAAKSRESSDLDGAPPNAECSRCARPFSIDADIVDVRLEPDVVPAPGPLEPGDLDATFDRARRGMTYRAVLEALLLDLPDERAERMMLLVREARGAWFPLLAASGGELLFVGNALSGTVTPLADAGFRVTILDRSLERLAFARLRADAHSPGRVALVLGGDSPRLPFADASFDVVVQEGALPGVRHRAAPRARTDDDASADTFAHDLAECARVAGGELVLTADTRLGYKRSSGRRGTFHVPGPMEFAAAAIAPERGERTLRGYRRAFADAGCTRARAFALYPHALDFSHVVAIDEPAPALTIGPMERKNRVKLAARAVGLFPVFTPSFALLGERSAVEKNGRAPNDIVRTTRIARMLRELAAKIGEPTPAIEQLVSTRGNTAIVHTSVPGAPESDERGRWTLHLPLAPKNLPQCERHFRALESLRARFPDVPVPEPLLFGRVDGVAVTCERRARGWTAPQMVGDRRCIARMLRETAVHFSKLVVRAPAPFTEDDFARDVGARFDTAAEHAAVPSTIDRLARLRDEMRERLIGKSIPRVVYHADLRAKHVQIDSDGGVTAYLDWGTTEMEGPPYHDLLHLVVHERKQEAGLTAAAAWGIVRDRERLRDVERESLASYARAVGIDDETCRAFELMYPVLVAAMAEKNWEYSRPRWLHKQFRL
jgi:aminoglycoside phosphotransferase (APT) family kinase protein